MPNDWAARVSNAINNLKRKTNRVVDPEQSLALIDDVVAGKFAAEELAVIHGLPQEGVSTTLRRVTRAVGTGSVRWTGAGADLDGGDAQVTRRGREIAVTEQ
jgi:hypothetical protein